jgi:hypothetical protein
MSEDSKEQVAQELKNRESMQHERLEFAERLAARRFEQESEMRRLDREAQVQQQTQLFAMLTAQQMAMMNIIKQVIPPAVPAQQEVGSGPYFGGAGPSNYRV